MWAVSYTHLDVYKRQGLGHLSVHGVQITSGAGVRLSHLARAACAHCLEGFSFMAGIPGSVGGALVMNAGAYGSSVSKVVEKVVLLNAAGEQEEREALALDFGYRRSNLLHSEYIVVEAVFRGVPGNAAKIQGEMDKGLAARRAAQPLEYPNAGSVLDVYKRQGVALLLAAVVGGCLGFLLFNHYPAKVFMGDTGSLALGGALGAAAVITHTELFLLVIGFVYVLEALSVIIQVFSFHVFQRRVFKRSP